MLAAHGAAVPAEELPPGGDMEHVTAWGRLVRVPPPCSPPTYITGQGADEGHEEGDQASLCL